MFLCFDKPYKPLNVNNETPLTPNSADVLSRGVFAFFPVAERSFPESKKVRPYKSQMLDA